MLGGCVVVVVGCDGAGCVVVGGWVGAVVRGGVVAGDVVAAAGGSTFRWVDGAGGGVVVRAA